MTIPASEPDKIIVNGNGVATSFSFSPMTIFESSNLQVTHVATNGAETLLAEGTGPTNYTVVVTSYPGTGSITYPSTGATRLATGESLVMKAVLPFEQELKLRNQGGYFPNLLEEALDKQVKLDIQLAETLDRTLRLPIGSDEDDVDVELPTPTANRLLGWNATADGLANFTALVGAVPVSAFMETVLDDATAAAARTTLAAAGTTAATTSATGLVELATDAETLTGSDTGRAVVPSSLLATMNKERGRIHNLRLVVSASANAITIAVKTAALVDASATDPIRMSFRRTTLTSSDDVERTLTGALSLVVSSGSTLGLLSSQTRRLYVAAIDNAGTIKLGVYNPLNTPDTSTIDHLPFDETRLYTTVAEGGAGAADSAQVLYSDSVYTTKAIRILGYFEIQTGGTAGEWSNQPTVVQLFNPGVPRSGSVIQQSRAINGATSTGTTLIPVDNTIPQLSTEGTQFLSKTVTFTSVVNLARITHVGQYDNGAASSNLALALFQDSTEDAIATQLTGRASGGPTHGYLQHLMLTGTVSATTFKLHAGVGIAGTTRFNGNSGAGLFGGTLKSYLSIEEVFV